MAFGTGTINSIGGAVNDLFAADAHRSRAAGDRIQATNYDLASTLATQNEKFTETSTAIKQAQNDRQIYQAVGGQQADVAGAGFASSGSALDLLRDSASQGALTKAVAGQQGLITEAGYTEQAESYTNLAGAARLAAHAEDEAASGSVIGSILHGVGAVASLIPGGSAISSIGNLFMGGGSPSGYGT
jgi:hypothetical protein